VEPAIARVVCVWQIFALTEIKRYTPSLVRSRRSIAGSQGRPRLFLATLSFDELLRCELWHQLADSPSDAFEQMLTQLSGSEASVRYYYILDRARLWKPLKR
jgi:hypothetical protein